MILAKGEETEEDSLREKEKHESEIIIRSLVHCEL